MWGFSKHSRRLPGIPKNGAAWGEVFSSSRTAQRAQGGVTKRHKGWRWHRLPWASPTAAGGNRVPSWLQFKPVTPLLLRSNMQNILPFHFAVELSIILSHLGFLQAEAFAHSFLGGRVFQTSACSSMTLCSGSVSVSAHRTFAKHAVQNRIKG